MKKHKPNTSVEKCDCGAEEVTCLNCERKVKKQEAYICKCGEVYMNTEQMNTFRNIEKDQLINLQYLKETCHILASTIDDLFDARFQGKRERRQALKELVEELTNITKLCKCVNIQKIIDKMDEECKDAKD